MTNISVHPGPRKLCPGQSYQGPHLMHGRNHTPHQQRSMDRCPQTHTSLSSHNTAPRHSLQLYHNFTSTLVTHTGLQALLPGTKSPQLLVIHGNKSVEITWSAARIGLAGRYNGRTAGLVLITSRQGSGFTQLHFYNNISCRGTYVIMGGNDFNLQADVRKEGLNMLLYRQTSAKEDHSRDQ
ncbi:hypothetical protein Bbelb_022580 [Branchiostoma belcheri]|nr:hypothetical protein Bbelb_022580 [Branchiostoma belcheri]